MGCYREKVTIEYHNSTIELIPGQFGNYGVSIDGMETGEYVEPDMVNNRMYLPIQFFMQMFGLESGYLPSSRMDIGIGLADNPVVWLDRIGTYDNTEKAQGDGLDWLKEELYKGLENFKKNNESGRFADDVARVAPKI